MILLPPRTRNHEHWRKIIATAGDAGVPVFLLGSAYMRNHDRHVSSELCVSGPRFVGTAAVVFIASSNGVIREMDCRMMEPTLLLRRVLPPCWFKDAAHRGGQAGWFVPLRRSAQFLVMLVAPLRRVRRIRRKSGLSARASNCTASTSSTAAFHGTDRRRLTRGID